MRIKNLITGTIKDDDYFAIDGQTDGTRKVPAAKVGSTGEYNDLKNKPSIPAKTSDLQNDEFVRYDQDNQGLTVQQKANARSNIGAGTSDFTGYTENDKLDADYVDDSESTNKFVTAAEKSQIADNAQEIAKIKDGTTVVPKAAEATLADNLTPYSEESGVIQDAPFILQGTGTDNNSVIVTTGTIAKQLEKQGNTVVRNQKLQHYNFDSGSGWASWNYGGSVSVSGGVATCTRNGTNTDLSRAIDAIPGGHTVLFIATLKTNDNNVCNFGSSDVQFTSTTNFTSFFKIRTFSTSVARIYLNCLGSNPTMQVKLFCLVDLTQWFNGNIPQDLLDHPENAARYGITSDLTYNAGELVNSNGRYLECGQSRNVWDGENDFIAIPNATYYCYGNASITFKDITGTTISTESKSNETFVAPSNCSTISVSGTNVCISLYYTTGDGYDQYYPYVAPKVYDTGSEPLLGVDGSRDTKLPSGLITRVRKRYTFTGNETWDWVSVWGAFRCYVITDAVYVNSENPVLNAILPGYSEVGNYSNSLNRQNMTFVLNSSSHTNNTFALINSSYGENDLTAFKAYMAGKTIEYELRLSAQTTEQGTPFSEYAQINDYSYMAWFDTDGNLVSIPQGCKLFYPVDYKGFADDLVMYTNGDATALAKKDEISDTALAERGYIKLTSIDGYDDTKTQTLKNVAGVFTWVDDE